MTLDKKLARSSIQITAKSQNHVEHKNLQNDEHELSDADTNQQEKKRNEILNGKEVRQLEFLEAVRLVGKGLDERTEMDLKKRSYFIEVMKGIYTIESVKIPEDSTGVNETDCESAWQW
jgi:hypothetical protein